MEKVICSIFWFGWLYTIAIGILLEYTIWFGIILLFLIIIPHSITITFAITEHVPTYKKTAESCKKFGFIVHTWDKNPDIIYGSSEKQAQCVICKKYYEFTQKEISTTA